MCSRMKTPQALISLSVIPANARTRFLFTCHILDYVLLLQHALRAIRSANVRSGILSPQSGVRREDCSIARKASG